MDLWLVAAATGAGYLAKYWKNQSREEDALSQLPFEDSNLVSSEYSNHFLNKFAPRKKGYDYEDVFAHGKTEESSSYMNPLDVASSIELNSMSGFENGKLGVVGIFQDFNELSTPNMVSRNRSDDFGILVCNSSKRIGSLHGTRRNRSTNKTRFSNGNLIKPLSSLEDFIMAHITKEQPKMEDRDPNSLPLPSSPTSSEAGISTATRNCSSPGTVVEEKSKTGKSRERKSRSFSKMVNKKDFDSKGSPDESFILYLGIFIGMISSFIAHKKEVHKLKELLRQTENLVRDLQEELEMKNSLKVQELVNDNCESQYTFSHGFSEKTADESTSKLDMDYSMNFNIKGPYEEQKAEESSESMSRIEAELEAELERMGLNIGTHSMEGFYDLDELDPKFIEDLAEGELKNDMISGQNSSWRKPNLEASNSTAHSGNYAVSPRELSLCMHEVIQSRLEARVEELETALQNKQRKLQLINTEYKNSWLELENDGLQQFSSNEKTPTQSLVMDSSEEATQMDSIAPMNSLTKVQDSEEGYLPSWGSHYEDF